VLPRKERTRPMKVLIAEDDPTSRKILQGFLTPLGECDVAENGRQAIEAFQKALAEERPYDLVCLDIMMPGMDGQSVLREIRRLEEEYEVTGLDGAKIIMTTALTDSKNIMEAFSEQCEAYLIKPIDKAKLMAQLEELGLLQETKP